MKLRLAITTTLALAVQLLVGASAHAMIANGMPAFDVIGQYDAGNVTTLTPIFTKGAANNGPNRLGFTNIGGGGSIDTTHHRLFVAEGSANNRVLVFNLNPDNTLTDKFADFVLGQSDFNSKVSAVTQVSVGASLGLTYDAVHDRLFVSDNNNSRVQVFDLSGGITNGMNAAFVLGQPNFTSTGTALTQTGMRFPRGLAYDPVADRLFVSDGWARVLVFDLSGGISNGMPAFRVLGQANFTSNTAATTQTGMIFPQTLTYDTGTKRLFVAEATNRRVLEFDLAGGVVNGMNATHVLGQPDFVSSLVATTQTGMGDAYGVAYDSAGGRLFVGDFTNGRVLQYDISATTTDGQAAAHVLGKGDFTTATAGTTISRISSAMGLIYDPTNQRLYVGDFGNRRLMIFDVSAISPEGEDAIDAIGQYDGNSTDPFNTTVVYTTSGVNNGPNRIGLSIGSSAGMGLDTVGHRLFVADRGNSRVLVFNLASDNLLTDRFADNVLGQPDFTGSATATTQAGMNLPTDVLYDSVSQRLFVGDNQNSRVLVFELSGGVTNGMNAAYVLGQAGFTSKDSVLSQSGISFSGSIAHDSASQRLFVADGGNRRVLVFNISGGISNGMGASNVIGQTDFTTASLAVTQAGMVTPNGVAYDVVASRLYVTENANRRVLVYDLSGGITNGMNAAYVLGEPNFTTSTGTTTQAGLRGPIGTIYDAVNKRLFVGDTTTSNRVVVYDLSATTTSGMNAAYVIGQPDFTSTTANTTQTGANGPRGFAYDSANQQLFVTDASNSRVMVYDVATTTGTVSPTLNNSVTLTSYAASATATATIGYTLVHNLSGLVTVAFPTGFTVNSAATALASSSCLTGFSFTSSTLTATKTNCAGPIVIGGATVTNPSAGGSYTISWINDDPGSAMVTITGGSGGGGGSQPATPTVTVIQPNGGETLTAGSMYSIVWASGGLIASYRISLSTNAGSSWSSVAPGVTGNYYLWTVPEIATDKGRIRVEGLSSTGSVLTTDETDANVVIVFTPPPPATTHDFSPSAAVAGTTSIDVDLGLVAVPNPLCAPGSAIRGTRSTVYYCGIDGMRYVFPNEKTWFTWYADFSSVRVLTNAQIATAPLSTRFVTYKPGVRMVKLQMSPKVYVVAAGGVLREIPNEQTASDLYGPDWATKVDDVPAPFWSSYTIGSPIKTN